MAIYDFKRPPYEFLTNMYPCELTWGGLTFKSAEAAFQAAKCHYFAEYHLFVPLNGYEAKELGKSVRLRADWEQIKVRVMRRVLALKFAAGSELAARLLATGDAQLFHENTHFDQFWGRVDGIGGNWLGIILMEQRTYLQSLQT